MIALVAVALIALALADTDGSDLVLGVATLAVWVVLAAGLSAPALTRPLTPTAALAALALALLAGWAALSLRWAGNDAEGFTDLVRILLYLGVFLLVAFHGRRASGPSWLTAIAVGGTAIALLALASRAFGFGSDAGLAAQLPLSAERISFPLGYWNALGYLMAMTLIPLVWLATELVPRGARLAAAATVPVVAVLFLTSSRGALFAAVLGLALVAGQAADRARLRRVALAAVPAWVAIVLAAAALRSELVAETGVSRWGLAILALSLLLALLTARAMRSLAPPPPVVSPERGPLAEDERRRAQERSRQPLSRAARLRWLIAGTAVVAAVAAVGPTALIGDFRVEDADGDRGATEALVSGSGRSSFWGAALDAFGTDPLRGVGAGGFEAYWTAEPRIPVPTRNAHSAPLETLAELGLPGGIALLAFLMVPLAALRRLPQMEPGMRSALAAGLGTLLAGLLAVGIDWSWEVPAATMPLIIAAGAITGFAFRGRGEPAASVLVDPGLAGYADSDASPAVPHRAIKAATLALAAAAIVAAGLLAVGAERLDRGRDELARGNLAEAAAAARAAAELQPWSPEPPLVLAGIEEAAKNYEAARRRAEEAARLAPDDYRPWLLLTTIHVSLGNLDAAEAYGGRTAERLNLGLVRPGAIPRG